jgi:hypothetical protein
MRNKQILASGMHVSKLVIRILLDQRAVDVRAKSRLSNLCSRIKLDILGETLQSCVINFCSFQTIWLPGEEMTLKLLQEKTGVILGHEIDKAITKASRRFTGHRQVKEIELVRDL